MNEPVTIDAKIERVRTTVVAHGPERVFLNQIVDRYRTLVLDVGTGTAYRRLVERDRQKAAGIAVVGNCGRHQRLSRIATERA